MSRTDAVIAAAGYVSATAGVLFITLMPMPIALAGVLGVTYGIVTFGHVNVRPAVTIVYGILSLTATAVRIVLMSVA